MGRGLGSLLELQFFWVHQHCEIEVFIEQFVEMPLSVRERMRVESETRLQRKCKAWHKERKGRITSSVFGRLINCRGKKETMMRYLYPKPFSNVATRWGQQCENFAIRDYQEAEGVEVAKIGLLLDDSGKLGASPDGCIQELNKLIEVKCPYSLRSNESLEEVIRSGAFYVKRDKSNKLVLDAKHSTGKQYYHQIQGQLHLSEWATSTDLIVWTPSQFLVVNVEKNPHWGTQYLPQLRKIWDEHMSVSKCD